MKIMGLSNITHYVNLQTIYNPPPSINYLTLTTLMSKLSHVVNLTDFQKDALKKVNDFCDSHNFTITNTDVFTERNHNNILERLATRILVKIHSDLIAPTTDLVTNVLQSMWNIYLATDANEELLALKDSPGSVKEQIAKGLETIKPLIDQECKAWANFFTPSNQKLIETHLHTIKHFLLTTSFISAIKANPKAKKELSDLIEDINKVEERALALFLEFNNVCTKILKKTDFKAYQDDELKFYYEFKDARVYLIELLDHIRLKFIPAIFEGINKTMQEEQRDPSFLEL